MKKFLLFAFAAVMLGFAGCNDDENKDNIPPTLREYVYESEDKSLSIGLYPLNDGLAAVEYLKN